MDKHLSELVSVNSFHQAVDVAFSVPRDDRRIPLNFKSYVSESSTSAGRVFSGESPALGANNGDVCGCHDFLEDVVAATLSVLLLRVKVPDLGLDDGNALERRYLLGGVVVELWLP
jgi:hypothetical protein